VSITGGRLAASDPARSPAQTGYENGSKSVLLKPNYYPAALQTYRTASVPYATPTHTRKSAQLIPIRNSVLSIKELYFASNISVSPLASIDGFGPLALVDTRKNLEKFHSGACKFSAICC